jgi:hypothetical protein
LRFNTRMSQELSNCYEVLGVVEGASAQELKTAYRDLAKVWHPDRFTHDPRLQQKAQEKLKEINEAYEQLTSGKFRFHRQTSGAAQQPRTQQNSSQKSSPGSPRATRQYVLLPACVFTFVLLVSGSLLIIRRTPSPAILEPEVNSKNVEQPLAEDTSDTIKERQRADRKSATAARQLPAETMKQPAIERAASIVTPLPTHTLTIDPTTGLIATAHCPVKSRMTYADGTEPRRHCSLHAANAGASDGPQQKDSRLKSLSKRIASPTRWFQGKDKSASAQQETPASQNPGQQN